MVQIHRLNVSLSQGCRGQIKRDHAAVDEQAALDDLETFAQNWDNKYPKIAKSWRENVCKFMAAFWMVQPFVIR